MTDPPPRMIDFTATYTDQYQLAMAQVYFLSGRSGERAVFDYFFRKLPFGGGYAVFAGLDDLLDVLEQLRFSEADLAFLRASGMDGAFVESLRDFRFRGDVHAAREGDLVFPTRPVVTVEADLIEAQIVETLLLNLLNFQTLVATKASRIRQVAGDAQLVDFGLRRAQGAGGYHASRAAIVGGFDATSNVRAGRDYGIPVSGTMAHSFVQSFDDEVEAFRAFARGRPDDCVLLVDTYSTLSSGVPNAITVGLEMAARGQRLKAVRLDSGDLAWLARETRRMLDGAGLPEVRIAASNQLDEHVIRSLREQGAPIDLYGVGTSLVTGQPDAALDGVYKLALFQGRPRLKLSESVAKTTLPGRKQVFRVLDEGGGFLGADVVALHDEGEVPAMHHPFEPFRSLSLAGYRTEPLLHPVMRGGWRLEERRPLAEIRDYGRQRLALLGEEYKRFENPHLYKVGLSPRLKEERDRLIQEHRSGPAGGATR
jgi:nicotinate phosphoribosyltransferase